VQRDCRPDRVDVVLPDSMVTQELARSIRAIHLEALVGAAKCCDIVDDVLAVGVPHVDPEGEVRTGLLLFVQLIERR
jgi:hypothetical protein